MSEYEIKIIKIIINILYLIHFFDYCILYKLSLEIKLLDHDKKHKLFLTLSDNNVIKKLNKFMVSILNRYSIIHNAWLSVVYRAIIFKSL